MTIEEMTAIIREGFMGDFELVKMIDDNKAIIHNKSTPKDGTATKGYLQVLGAGPGLLVPLYSMNITDIDDFALMFPIDEEDEQAYRIAVLELLPRFT